MAASDLRWSGRSCGADCGLRRPGPVPVRRAVASWNFDPAAGCTLTRLAVEQDCNRVAQAFIAAALRLGPAALKPCRERP
ncbi:MAG: hypothetical protein HOV87_24695 [Catenulispora sp.]|nr:hypothetical protein [Catenulispora sp.]